jgi:hypothetical protein
LTSELGQRLFENFRNSENADCYLVRGVVIVTDRDGVWDTRFPDYEVPSGIEQSGQELLLNIPSAFRLFVSTGERPKSTTMKVTWVDHNVSMEKGVTPEQAELLARFRKFERGASVNYDDYGADE